MALVERDAMRPKHPTRIARRKRLVEFVPVGVRELRNFAKWHTRPIAIGKRLVKGADDPRFSALGARCGECAVQFAQHRDYVLAECGIIDE